MRDFSRVSTTSGHVSGMLLNAKKDQPIEAKVLRRNVIQVFQLTLFDIADSNWNSVSTLFWLYRIRSCVDQLELENN